MARIWVWVLGAGWVTAVILSAVMFAVTEPTDFGLTAGWNRIGVFFGWQLAALILALGGAIAALWVARPRGWPVLIAGFGPLAASGLFVLTVLGFVVWINASRPAPEPLGGGTPTTTAPTAPAIDDY